MNCSFCCAPLLDQYVQAEKFPLESRNNVSNVHLSNERMEEFLHLHAECIDDVIEGLRFARKMVVH